MGVVIPFPQRSARPVVFIDVVDEDGGCWGIFRALHGSEKLVFTRFAFDDAFSDAERYADEIGGEFDDGTNSPGGEAA